MLCDDRRTLLWLANQRAVEYHVPFFRHRRPAASDGPGARPGPAGGADLPDRGGGGPAGPGGVGRGGPRGRGQDERGQGAARRRPGPRRPRRGRRGHPGAGGPHGAAGPGDRDHRLPQGGAGRKGVRRLHAGGPGNHRGRYKSRSAPGCRSRRRCPGSRWTTSVLATSPSGRRGSGSGTATPGPTRPGTAATAGRSGRRGPHHPDRAAGRPCTRAGGGRRRSATRQATDRPALYGPSP